MDLSRELKVALNTGKVEIGYRVGLKTASKKKAKLIVIASNTPENFLEKVKQIVGADIPIYKFPGSSWDLGGICGKPFPVSTITIIDPGESAILKVEEG
jgi:large subunit ribosomal protein L30e